MKRFWKIAEPVPAEGGWEIALDRKKVRTPASRALLVGSKRLADAIAEEWNEAGETVDPRAMRLTGLANAAIDRIAPDPAPFAAGLAAYGESDLACYRAASPPELAGLQQESWDALLGWARRRYDVDFQTTSGITHVAQPEATIARLGHAVAALDPFELAGLSPLVTIGGSLVAALALFEGQMGVEAAWAAVTIDDAWQAGQWGADAEAAAALEVKRSDFFAAAHFLELLSA